MPSLPQASTMLALQSGSVAGFPRLLLRVEGAVALAAALVAYAQLGGSWSLFAALFLVPDLALLGYFAGSRAGAIAYNATHSYLAPALLALCGGWQPSALARVAIWVAHIGFDRLLGYGLKYGAAFQDTHLGRVGRGPAAVSGKRAER